MSDPFKDTRDPLVRSTERRPLEELMHIANHPLMKKSVPEVIAAYDALAAERDKIADESIGFQACIRALEAALRKAVSAHTGHFPWCAKGGQMPMEMGRQYTHPTDWDNWRATVECTCGIATLLTVRETGAEHG